VTELYITFDLRLLTSKLQFKIIKAAFVSLCCYLILNYELLRVRQTTSYGVV